jgi:hypothetical protein
MRKLDWSVLRHNEAPWHILAAAVGRANQADIRSAPSWCVDPLWQLGGVRALGVVYPGDPNVMGDTPRERGVGIEIR